ncbi:hypothetical protein ON010_g16046 [Phytophthora cinnamomi]|nr:hypothetical protein ON010_g16046 [Phytophthora cinnamomi]
MTRQRGQQATYDQMMAELQLGSDEDEREVKPRRDHRKYDGLESRRRVTLPASRPEEKVDPIPNKKDARSEAKSSAVDAIDGDSRRRRLSFPSSNDKSPSRKGSSSVSRSHNSEGDFPHDSDDSDQEREAPVINANRELFGAASASSKDGEFSGETRRAEIDALRSFVMRSPAQGSAAIRSGSEYTMYDDGMSPDKTALEANVRNILGAVEFSYDDMGPGRLAAQIPLVQSNGAASIWKDKQTDAGSADSGNLLMLHNKRPHFDEKTCGHVLDFGGRVTMPSIKNFQMMCDVRHESCSIELRTELTCIFPTMSIQNLGDETVLQFGRVSCQPPGPRRQCKCHKSIFIMDVKASSYLPCCHDQNHVCVLTTLSSLVLQYPLSPLQAFAICLATLDTKFTDLKLYDNVSKLIKRK